MKKYIVITFIIIFSCVKNDFYEGTVRDKYGPLENVIVMKYGANEKEVQTDKNGYFKLPKEVHITHSLMFVRKGYETEVFLPIRSYSRKEMFIKGDSTVLVLQPCYPCKP